jgi:putative ABC transport system substrate-binding protein
VLIGLPPSDPQAQASIAALQLALVEFGWRRGSNLHLEIRYANSASELARAAAELVSWPADAIVARSTPVVAALLRETRTIPVVFTVIGDPIQSGFVASFNRPGGNATGFTSIQLSIGSKWPGLLKEIAPSLRRVGIVFNPDTVPRRGSDFLDPIGGGARVLSLNVIEAPVRTGAEIERVIASLANEPGTGLIALPDLFTFAHRESIAKLATQYLLPSIYPYRSFVTSGGLISYGSDLVEQFRQAAVYVDKIFKGAKAAELPVEQPTKFELVINLKTAKALGLDIPPQLLARADEVIE